MPQYRKLLLAFRASVALLLTSQLRTFHSPHSQYFNTSASSYDRPLHSPYNMKTITFSRIGSLDIKLDLYVLDIQHKGPLPALVFYHGGGTVAGNRKDAAYHKGIESMSVEPPHYLVLKKTYPRCHSLSSGERYRLHKR